MDSLADMVSFGAAPAVDRLPMGAGDLGKTRAGSAFVYIAGAALAAGSLQRPTSAWSTSALFQGCQPGGGGAGHGADLVWSTCRRSEGQAMPTSVGGFGVAYAGLPMVTNAAAFYGFKVVGGRRAVPFIVIVAIALRRSRWSAWTRHACCMRSVTLRARRATRCAAVAQGTAPPASCRVHRQARRARPPSLTAAYRAVYSAP